jgi:hypothetical protein
VVACFSFLAVAVEVVHRVVATAYVVVIVAIGPARVGMISEEQFLVVVEMSYMAPEIAQASVGMEMAAVHSLVVVACVVANVDLMEVAAFVSATFLLREYDSTYTIGCSWLIPKCL